MKLREPLPNDNEKVELAYQLLIELIKSHQSEIEPALWIGAMIGSLADNFEKSDIDFNYFKEEMLECIDHYKY